MLVADWGIGDHYIVAGLAEAVRERYGLRVWMAGKARLSFLSGLFPKAERYLDWPTTIKPSTITTPVIRGGAFYYAHFPGLELMRAVGYGGFHFIDAYRCRLGLTPQATLSTALRPSMADVARATDALRACGFDPATTILVSTTTTTTPTSGIEESFWLDLRSELVSAGLRVVLNAALGSQPPPGWESMQIALPDVRATAMACVGVCSLRSGLSDLLCDLPVPHVVVYPQAPYWSGLLQKGTTFARYNLAHPPWEFVVTPSSARLLAKEIAVLFQNRRPDADRRMYEQTRGGMGPDC
ncbi:hypothetical protein [Termitidicoccus mucosus]|uniref:hypothetical protein n=1 Tax=Termitidicoccus mucosus TaxID=1184151 RepID=UPI0011AB4F85